MNDIKICVIGAGTAGVVSVLAILNAAKRENVNVQVTCMYDPLLPTIQVGESTSSPILGLLTELIDFRILKDLNDIDGTLKYGSKYVDWNTNEFFVHHIQPAIHLNSAKFSFWVLEKLIEKFPSTFTTIHDTITNLHNNSDSATMVGKKSSYEYDYVIDCRGFPTLEDLETDNYIEPTFSSVNSVIIYPEFKTYNEMYTTSQAHSNGWLFEIPLTFRKAFGYLYNKNVTSKEQAIEDFKALRPNIDIEKTRQLSWTSFYRKNIVSNRIMYSGNKLFFFEPSQGFPLHYYAVFADFLIHSIGKKLNVEETLNKYYTDIIEDIQDVIALTYQANTKFDSNFWKYAKQYSRERLLSSNKFITWCNDHQSYTHFASHSNEIMFSLINGMGIDLEVFKKV